MSEDSVINFGTASIGSELLFGILISSINFIHSAKEYKSMMLASLIFDASKIAIAYIFINLTRSVSPSNLKNFQKAIYSFLSIFTAVIVAMISNILCMWICVHIWNLDDKSFPGLKELSILSLVLFSVVRVALFTVFMILFVQYIRHGKGRGYSLEKCTDR